MLTAYIVKKQNYKTITEKGNRVTVQRHRRQRKINLNNLKYWM